MSLVKFWIFKTTHLNSIVLLGDSNSFSYFLWMIQTNFTEILPFCLYWHVLKLLFRFVVCVSVPTKMLNKLVLIRKISPCTYIVCVSKVQFSYRRNMFPWTPLSEISNDSILKLQSSRDLSGKREVWVERTFGSSVVEQKDEEGAIGPYVKCSAWWLLVSWRLSFTEEQNCHFGCPTILLKAH